MSQHACALMDAQVGGVTAWDFFSHFADPVCAANPECRNLRPAAEFYLLRMLQEYDMMVTFLPSELAMAAVSLAARVVGASLGPRGTAGSGSESEPDIPDWASTRRCGTRMLSVLNTAPSSTLQGAQKCFTGYEHYNVTALPLPKDW
jgi:hypothetical protein